MLDKLNTKSVGVAGVAVGSLTLIGAATRLVELLSDPTYLTALYSASVDHMQGHVMTQADIMTVAQLVGAMVAVVGALLLAILAANVGKSIFKNDPAAISGATGGASVDTPTTQDKK